VGLLIVLVSFDSNLATAPASSGTMQPERELSRLAAGENGGSVAECCDPQPLRTDHRMVMAARMRHPIPFDLLGPLRL
jgi:hypothetical protein